MKTQLLDHTGQPLVSQRQLELAGLRRQLVMGLRAKYDAAQTSVNNERHWGNADNLDPHAANSLTVRRKLRSRSRYEVVENNPYLKGVILTIANDFIGSGPRLQITDKRLSPERRRIIERRFSHWAAQTRLRQKLWRMRMAKIVDGESFLFAYTRANLRDRVKLDFYLSEADRVSSEGAISPAERPQANEIDGVRFDEYENPVQYHLLNQHPGSSWLNVFNPLPLRGKWVNAKFVVHWFRQDRGWLRGIPETTPSLPLCSMLRRYTLAVVRAAEVAADFSAVLETDGPPNQAKWTDGQGGGAEDDPFDMFPIEMGMFVTMPWGYKMKQLSAEQPTTMYDKFVDALLREIVRPLLCPFNISAGTSKDSNMASGILDSHIYKGGQEAERLHCSESVLEPVFDLWWAEAIREEGYLDEEALSEADFLQANPSLRNEPPTHSWRWDRIGVDHTDPLKVAQAVKVLHDKQFLTDRDIQETYYNRDVEDWRENVREDLEFREEIGMVGMGDSLPQAVSDPANPDSEAPNEESDAEN